MHRRSTTCLAIAMCAALLALPATAQLFGSEPGGGGGINQLVSVNPVTGMTTPIGPFVGAPTNVTEIEFDAGGTLYATTGGGSASLLTINPATGAVLTVVMHAPGAINGLEFTPGGTLLGAHIPFPGMPSTLVQINTATGALTNIGGTGVLNIGGLAFDPSCAVLYGVTSNAGIGAPPMLLTLNTATGMATPVAAVTVPAGVEISSLEFDSTGRMIAAGNDAILYMINPATAMAAPIGPLVASLKLSGLSLMGGVCMQNVPYPGTGEDFVMRIRLNGVPSPGSVHNTNAGDLVSVTSDSPGGTFTGTPLAILGEPFPTGTPPVSIFPGLAVSGVGTVVIHGGPVPPLGFICVVPPSPGHTFAFTYPGGLPGLSLMLQSIASAPFAANGIFASTDGNELMLN